MPRSGNFMLGSATVEHIIRLYEALNSMLQSIKS